MSDDEAPRVRSKQWLAAERRAVALDGGVFVGGGGSGNHAQGSKSKGAKLQKGRGNAGEQQEASGENDENRLSNKAKKREAMREQQKAKKDAKKAGAQPISKKEKQQQENAVSNSVSDFLLGRCFSDSVGPAQRQEGSKKGGVAPRGKLLLERALPLVAETAAKVTAEPEKELATSFPFFLKLYATLDRYSAGKALRQHARFKNNKNTTTTANPQPSSHEIEQHQAQADNVKHCALISAVAVLRDILPGYRLRSDQPDRANTFLSRGVLRTQKFENLLLQMYEKVTTQLLVNVKNNPLVYGVPLCSLATRSKAMHFNFRTRLVTALVKLANRKIVADAEETEAEEWRLIVKPACDALEDIISKDKALEISKEIVTAAGLFAKRACAVQNGGKAKQGGAQSGSAQHQLLSPHLVSTLLFLRLDRSRELAEDDEEEKDEDLDREMMEGSLTTKKKKDLVKLEADILAEVIVIYLRILRVHFVFAARPGILRSALQGLAKFSTLVNVELLLEILNEVKDVLAHSLRCASFGVSSADDAGKKVEASKNAQDSQTSSNKTGSSASTSSSTGGGENTGADTALLALSAAVHLLSSPAGRALSLGDDLKWISDGLFEALPLFLLCRNAQTAEILKCVNLCAQECPQLFSKSSLGSVALLCEGLVHDLAGANSSVAASLGAPRNLSSANRKSSSGSAVLPAGGASSSCSGAAVHQAPGTTSSPSADYLVEAAKLLSKHQRLNSLLTSDGGLFGVLSANTGLTERPVQVFYALNCLAHSPEPRTAALATFLLHQKGKLVQLPPSLVSPHSSNKRTTSCPLGEDEAHGALGLEGVPLPKRQKMQHRKVDVLTSIDELPDACRAATFVIKRK
ncbi:unnamed protein product [Amoebophrya sp. A25]|nr:unnamed protein product [Amoebophrya sp. A25]|eukprot:GSA25T00014589001.1